MANSINTNYGANIALQNLNATSKLLETTQNRVNTGMKVSSAKDNGAIFAIATNQRAEMSSLDSIKQSIQRGQSIVDVALAAGDTVVAALTEMKSLAVAIEADGTTTSANYTALKADYDALQTEITKAFSAASFDGVNLWSATATTSVKVGTGATDTYAIGVAAPANGTPAAVTAAGVDVAGVYVNAWFWRRHMLLADPSEFGALWLADWGDNPVVAPPAAPDRPWPAPLGLPRPAVWQFTSRGIVDGVEVDLDCAL